jgi:DNA-binding Xre family transcriptional regulator
LLKSILIERKITQTKLAEMANLEIGQVSNLCSGLQSDCLMSTAKRICNALEVRLEDIFGD